MVTRIVTALVAIPIGILIIALNNEVLYYVAMTAFSVIAVYEMLVTTKYLKNKFTSAVSLIFAAVTPIIFWIEPLRNNVKLIYFGFVVIMLLGMLFNHEKARFEQVALVAFVSITIPLALCSIAFIRSWEGFVGGIITSGVFAVIMSFAYELIDSMINGGVHTFSVNWVYLTVMALVISGLGVVGDLSASLVKRECSVKDFGNILPGHGGILDRFDSVLLAAPFAYMMFQIYFPITPIA